MIPCRFRSTVAALLATSSLLLTEVTARASDPTTQDCLTANDDSIRLRADHKFRDARAQLLVCAASSCPADIRNACMRRVQRVNDAMPTIVFEVKDDSDNEMTAVAVTMDGQPLVARLEGTAISLDPGEHVFGFEAAGKPKVEKRLVIHEGEKERRELVRMALALPPKVDAPIPEATPPTPVSSVPASPSQEERKADSVPAEPITLVKPARETSRYTETYPQRVTGYVMGGAGIALLAGATYLLVSSSSKRSSIQQGGFATGSDIASAARSASLEQGVGIAGVVVGSGVLVISVILWLTASPHSSRSAMAPPATIMW
jgi:hypothetical protein